MSQQPEALRLADELERPVGTQSTYSAMQQAAAELRRLHEVNAELLEVLGALVERVNLNGGLGEYRGGVPFILRRATEAIAKAEGQS
jgi:hypothetical protein